MLPSTLNFQYESASWDMVVTFLFNVAATLLSLIRSQTYSAKEVDLILAMDLDTEQPIEWVVIDPEAFTGMIFWC